MANNRPEDPNNIKKIQDAMQLIADRYNELSKSFKAKLISSIGQTDADKAALLILQNIENAFKTTPINISTIEKEMEKFDRAVSAIHNSNLFVKYENEIQNWRSFSKVQLAQLGGLSKDLAQEIAKRNTYLESKNAQINQIDQSIKQYSTFQHRDPNDVTYTGYLAAELNTIESMAKSLKKERNNWRGNYEKGASTTEAMIYQYAGGDASAGALAIKQAMTLGLMLPDELLTAGNRLFQYTRTVIHELDSSIEAIEGPVQKELGNIATELNNAIAILKKNKDLIESHLVAFQASNTTGQDKKIMEQITSAEAIIEKQQEKIQAINARIATLTSQIQSIKDGAVTELGRAAKDINHYADDINRINKINQGLKIMGTLRESVGTNKYEDALTDYTLWLQSSPENQLLANQKITLQNKGETTINEEINRIVSRSLQQKNIEKTAQHSNPKTIEVLSDIASIAVKQDEKKPENPKKVERPHQEIIALLRSITFDDVFWKGKSLSTTGLTVGIKTPKIITKIRSILTEDITNEAKITLIFAAVQKESNKTPTNFFGHAKEMHDDTISFIKAAYGACCAKHKPELYNAQALETFIAQHNTLAAAQSPVRKPSH